MSNTFLPRLAVSAPTLDGNELRYVQECIESTWISSRGRFLDEFEAAFAAFCGTKHAIACNNGTTALHLALVAMGIGPGDEVIIPDLTYIASANAVTYCGATPVFVESDFATYNIDPAAIEAAITPRTKAIMPVHLFGHPCDMDPILDLAERYSLMIIEDAAEAHGAEYKGRRVGGIGHCASFSFFGNKIITTGEGGALTTNDDALAERLRLLRSQGMDPHRRYWFPVVGYNYRMTNLAAAIGLAQMETIERKIATRKQIAAWYDEALAGLNSVIRPKTEAWANPVYWIYTISLADSAPIARDDVMQKLDELGIETRPVFYLMRSMPPYAHCPGEAPVAQKAAERGISLPTHGQMQRSDVTRVAEALARVLGG